MPDYESLFHGCAPDGSRISIGVGEGMIAAVGTDVPGTAATESDFGDAVIFPGVIDAHVHFNEPGRADWEGLATGSRALAAGGGTVFIDMPLNSTPPVATAEDFETKRRIACRKSCIDFALWGALIPSSLGHLESMAHAGAAGFKAFMCHSGLDEFPAADSATLKAGMKIAAGLKLPVAVHAELPYQVPVGGRDMAAWLASRPIRFELDAIQAALDLAGETGCSLHIVHVTCPEGIDLVSRAKSRGVDVTVETCPHYLLLDADDAIRIGAAAKCAPPIRGRACVDALWNRLLEGAIDTIGSDHSPAPPELKQGGDMFSIWGGIAGVQHGAPLLLGKSLQIMPALTCKPARRFRLAAKGALDPGCSADFFVARRNPKPILQASLLTRHRISPYLGMTSPWEILGTYLRGEPVTGETRGRFLRPTPI